MTKKVSNGFIRQAVYAKYNGHCAYCGCEIDYNDMQVDHIEPKCRGNERYVGRVGEDTLRITIHPAACATSTKACPMSSSSVKGCEKNLITSEHSLREWLSDMES